MFTQCPDCRKIYPVSKKLLRSKKPQLFCVDCKKKFNANTLLNEKTTALVSEAKAEYIPKSEFKQKANPKKITDTINYSIDIKGFIKKASSNIAAIKPETSESAPERLPWEVDDKTTTSYWLYGFIGGLILLLGQFFYFESGKWSQNPSSRPQMEKLCRLLDCQLADYENLAEFNVLQGSFTPNADNTMAFKAVINNQSAFKQRLPNIKLTLLDFDEQVFAQRIFAPKEYLSNSARATFSVNPDETVEANLTIAVPKTPIGGYNFDLVY